MKTNANSGLVLAVRRVMEGEAAERLARAVGRIAQNEDQETVASEGDIRVYNAGSVRVIEVRGIMARDVAGWFPYATDTEELERVMMEADDDDTVDSIVLDIDSPGGTVNGTPEAASVVASTTKPLVAYTAGGMYSAAYYLAAAADMILARPSAGLGSIGVIAAHVDMSGLYESEGVKVEVFRSGENKAPGAFGLALTDGQRAMIQQEVDDMGEQFRAHVMTYRPEVDSALLDGREFVGYQAVQLGFADDIISNINGAIATAKSLAGM